jgi:rod shape-determining protein MreC
MLPKGELLKQLEALRREYEKLRIKSQQAEETTRENNRLRQLLGWQQKHPWKLKLANVVLHDPANWWRTVQIDLGSRDGISTNLPVLTPDGFLAGRISSVSLTRSQVVLIGDPNCKVAARVENESRDTGVIGPGGPLDRQLVELGYLPRTATVKPGQKVKTSGDGGIFPKDISIGQVSDVHAVESGLAQAARVQLGGDLTGMEEVWVLFP